MKPRKASNTQPAIAATREAYKRCGKDPSRYRPSAEALRRRLMRGLELYQIDTLVDLINSYRSAPDIPSAASMRTRYRETALNSASDVRKSLRRHRARNAEHRGASRRTRDRAGGIGTPTSDNERTKMGLETRRILAIVNGYNGREGWRKPPE